MVISKPFACIPLIAGLRPGPIPFTLTATLFKPNRTIAFLTTLAATTCAAKGVDFFDPLNPEAPALDHTKIFPCSSLIEIIVLLKVA